MHVSICIKYTLLGSLIKAAGSKLNTFGYLGLFSFYSLRSRGHELCIQVVCFISARYLYKYGSFLINSMLVLNPGNSYNFLRDTNIPKNLYTG